MTKNFFIIFFVFLFFGVHANDKKNIIDNLQKTKNLNFLFEQNINGKIETGDCIIEFPKKIFCKYQNNNNKILISNGKSLVIKTLSSYYRYPLKKTPLNIILDKKILINKIIDLEEKTVDRSYIYYQIKEGNNEINIFFDNKNFNLVGWQTKDIYQNFNITLLSSIKINQKVAKNLFKLPPQN
tara:strand:+ start:3221 stop:3769 length:549 start_codon:yes stop_codon:yes gene_type:complete